MVDSVYMPSHPLSAPAERLVEAAQATLAEAGVEGLTLRAVARRAGVSHGAPLRHFESTAALRSELAARGFRALDEAIDKAASQAPGGSSPLRRLEAAGRAYVDQAVANPALFALMFRQEELDPAYPGLAERSAAAFDQLVRHVRAAQDVGLEPGQDTRVLASSLWALVHGIATLWSQGALASTSGASLDSILVAALAIWIPQETPEGTEA